MKKITLLMLSLLLTVGAMAQVTLATVADGVYTISGDEGGKRGNMSAGEGFADYPVLSNITYSGCENNSVNPIENGKNWYVFTIENKTYLYNIGLGKFVAKVDNNINFADTPYAWSIVVNGSYTSIYDTTISKYLSMGCGRAAANRPIAWDTNSGDGGAQHTFTPVVEGDFSAAIANAKKAFTTPSYYAQAGIPVRFKQVLGGNYLHITEYNVAEKIQIKNKVENNTDQFFCFEPTEEANKFYIKSVSGYYIQNTGSWNCKAVTSGPTEYLIEEKEQGIYTLHSAQGYFGTNQGQTTDGQPIYTNHPADRNTITWKLEVVEAQELLPGLKVMLDNVTSNYNAHNKVLSEGNLAETAIAAATNKYNEIKDNATRSTIKEFEDLIAAASDALKSVIYINDVSEISNNISYTVTAAENRGSWYSEDEHLNGSTKIQNFTYNITAPEQQFAFVKSDNSGKYYLYSVAKEKFVKRNDKKAVLVETPEESSVEFLSSTHADKANFPWVISLNGNHVGISNGNTPAVITNYNNVGDGGNSVRLEKAATFDATAALAKINTFETTSLKTELSNWIAEATALAAKTFIGEETRNALNGAAQTAQTVHDNINATYSQVKEQVDILEAAVLAAGYVTKVEDFSNNAIYTFVAKYDNGSYLMYDAEKNANNAISSSKYSDINKGEDVATCQWAVYKSTNGNYYLYNVAGNKFLGTVEGKDALIPVEDKPTSTKLVFKVSRDSEYPIMLSVNDGTGVLNHNKGDRFATGLINWQGGWGDDTSEANVHKVAVVGALEDATLENIETLVANYESIGLKQEELSTLLANVKSYYYDEWASGDYKWRIGTGINNYTQPESTTRLDEAYATAEGYKTSENVEEIEEQIAIINDILSQLTINQPTDGKYYRLRCVNGQKYLSSNVNDGGRLQMTKSKDFTNIFYYTNGGLVSYAKGLCIHATNSSNAIKLRGVGETSLTTFVDGKENEQPGSYIINIKNSADETGRWIHGENDLSDSGSSMPTGGSKGYNWWLEEVTELPVTVTSAGYATFFAPVAVTVPSGVTAHTVTINDEWATLTEIEGGVIPANTGVVLAGEANTYNFAITTTEATAESALTGTVAATYITDDAYVLGYINEEGAPAEVGFGIATKNQQSNTSWLNNSHKAYLPKPAASGVSFYGFRFDEEENTTGIEVVENANENVIYDLAGRRVSEITAPGIYIIDGKKVLVK